MIKKWWKDAGERLVKTALQVGIGVVVLKVSGDPSMDHVSWATALHLAAVAAVASLLTSIVSKPVGDPASASLVDLRR
jgi:hypothetical protein